MTALLEYLNLNADLGPCCITFSINPVIMSWKDVYKVGL